MTRQQPPLPLPLPPGPPPRLPGPREGEPSQEYLWRCLAVADRHWREWRARGGCPSRRCGSGSTPWKGRKGETVAIYVDELFDTAWANKAKWPYARSCHMTADSAEELHAFAARLGLRRSWAQREGGPIWLLHYDLTATKRALAVKLGAIEVDAREQARKRVWGEETGDD